MCAMKERLIGRKVLEFAKSYPVVTITGPRQSGKTTLAKMLFPGYRYVNLESLTEREFAKSDPVAFLRQFESDNVIIDEVQRVPDLLSQIQVEVDARKRNIGLACYLLGITDSGQLSAHPLRGELFETMVVGEYFKRTANDCGHSRMNYYRDSNRNEIDLVMQNGSQTTLCEIKSGSTFSGNWTNTMTRLSGQFGADVGRTVVYGGDTSQRRTSFDLVSWREI